MTTRLLPVTDWWVLDGTEAGRVLPLLTPCASEVRALAVFDGDGCFAGCWIGLRMAHLEGVHVEPVHRGKSGVQRALLRGMKAVCAEWGVTAAITGAADEAIRTLLSRKGRAERLPDTYVLRMS